MLFGYSVIHLVCYLCGLDVSLNFDLRDFIN